jgi:hypothetical protein
VRIPTPGFSFLESDATPIFPGRCGDREELVIVPMGQGRIKLTLRLGGTIDLAGQQEGAPGRA